MAAEFLFTFDDLIARVATDFNATGWKMVRHREPSANPQHGDLTPM
jgi:hypothetical protein